MENVEKLLDMLEEKAREGMEELSLHVPKGLGMDEMASLLLLVNKAMLEAKPLDISDFKRPYLSSEESPTNMNEEICEKYLSPSPKMIRLTLFPTQGRDKMKEALFDACYPEAGSSIVM